jgi:hypothetical protein
VYIADYSNNRIRLVTVSTGIITTIAGSSTSGGYSGDNGAATSAILNYPFGVALDSTGNHNASIFDRNVNSFSPSPSFLLGNVYIADQDNHRIRKVTVSTGIITTIAGTGTASYSGDNSAATSATLYQPRGVSLDASGNLLTYFYCFIDYSVPF